MENKLIKKEKPVLVKRIAKTSGKYGCDFNQRPIQELINYGVINIDKPKGPTSHQVSAYVNPV